MSSVISQIYYTLLNIYELMWFYFVHLVLNILDFGFKKFHVCVDFYRLSIEQLFLGCICWGLTML